MDEDVPSSSSEDVPSRADAAGVITWLKPVGESQAYAFWKKFFFLPMSRFYFLPRGLVLRLVQRMIEGE